MTSFFSVAARILIGFASGLVISGGVFLIVIIGIVPRLAQKTRTGRYIYLYEDMISLGGIAGTLTMLFDVSIPIWQVGNILSGFFYGIFVGTLAISIAEVLDVIPILCRRFVPKKISYLMLMLALGKCAGALVYFFIPGFMQLK